MANQTNKGIGEAWAAAKAGLRRELSWSNLCLAYRANLAQRREARAARQQQGGAK